MLAYHSAVGPKSGILSAAKNLVRETLELGADWVGSAGLELTTALQVFRSSEAKS
jgi:hypothetical protein